MSNIQPLAGVRQRPQTAPRRAIALVRVSMESDKLTSPENQRYAIEQYAERTGDQIIEWVEGIDESGSRKKSAWWAKLDSAIERMERGDADVILVWKFSRTARHRLKWAVALDRVDSAGGSLESVTEQTDPTPSGRFARGMIGEMNAYQAELIGEVWTETHERRRRAGLPATGGPRFGYVIEDGRYEPDPETGPVLTDLYRRYLAGAGAAQLTKHINALGITTTGGRRWTYQALMSMLDTGFAAGLLGRARAARHVWEREYLPGAHEALITRETWDAYVAARIARYRLPAREAGKYLLTGMIRCGDCGARMHGHQYPTGPTYVCSRATVTDGHRKVSIVGWRAEQAVERWLFELADDVSAQAAVQQQTRRKAAKTDTRRARLRQALEQAHGRLATLTMKLADGTISDAAYSLAAERIESDRLAAERQLAMLVDNPVQKSAVAKLPTELAELWPLWTNSQKQAVLRPLIRSVDVAPASRRGARLEERVTVTPIWGADQNDG